VPEVPGFGEVEAVPAGQNDLSNVITDLRETLGGPDGVGDIVLGTRF